METMSSAMDQLWVLATTYGARVIGVILVIFGAFIVAGMVRRSIEGALSRAKVDVTLARFLASTARYTVLVLAAVGCLGVFGVETTSFAALLAGAGLAIGLAFQGSLSSLAAGVMLLIFRPFKVGQYVIVGGTAGTVESIELFTTSLKTPDNRLLIIPNAGVFGATIENVSHFPERRVDVAVGVAYNADIDKTREILNRAVTAVDGVLSEPAPAIFLKELGASSVDWVLRAWCKSSDYWAVHERLVRAAKVALDEAGIGIPYPQLDIHLGSGTELLAGRGKAQPEAHA